MAEPKKTAVSPPQPSQMAVDVRSMAVREANDYARTAFANGTYVTESQVLDMAERITKFILDGEVIGGASD